MSQTNTADKEQPLIAHLIELRQRVMRIVLFVLVIFAGLFYFANDLYAYLSAPLTALLPEGTSMIATDVTSPFFAPFKLALVLAVFIGIPYILHQIWSFIAPGLYENEKHLAVPLLISSIFLFYAGIAFAYFVVFPLVFGFFTSVGPENVAVMTDISSYLNFVLKLFFAFGVVFEIPIATLLLIWSGATTAQSLGEKRAYVIVGCFVVGMLLTPPDIISQSLLALPMWLLFEVGLIMGRIFVRNTDEEEFEDEFAAAEAEDDANRSDSEETDSSAKS
ncbi:MULTISPECIES: twin-arginine translocase subunit TatC [unclassified Marinobacterium]|jgi:sec-independent protein translocase protein TatC|uniref:twin-arginine translocase subunit TatC n=1 Tax=unclassified Marinobacterium TaxID=2644139 RepID=UPI001567F960|nr:MULTISPECIES: twin-arginine translocase subunit TatC [unclassified Marinobacterium]NRP10806.1 Sec-independent protein translocase protein TatC [Marinobacterium sp. xm-g-48]NRP14914.1 Sec-independent protein translocase protein TatC [Marinobacterium sp. xm-a-152]NRP27422.1 Sec-independent protein translocase protein TatC [Marinobacterium sp. xm-d-420]NRP36728.1 Sec-independent protein translocase protein TatC [Marinobacterium sp. xm-d-579]NRP38641.1 Sec-independent protein translocase protei